MQRISATRSRRIRTDLRSHLHGTRIVIAGVMLLLLVFTKNTAKIRTGMACLSRRKVGCHWETPWEVAGGGRSRFLPVLERSLKPSEGQGRWYLALDAGCRVRTRQIQTI